MKTENCLVDFSGVSPTAIAVQSPYIAQVQLLRDRLAEYPEASRVEVSTIDSFQGREADAVIISMVIYIIMTVPFINLLLFVFVLVALVCTMHMILHLNQTLVDSSQKM